MLDNDKPRVPFNDLRITDPRKRNQYLEAVDKVLLHGRVLLGPEVEELETRIAAYCNRKYAVGVGSGTDALMVGFMALGIGPGDEVIVSALSWIASANAIKMVGANVVFVDVDDTMNIDPSAIEVAITQRTKAILAVDYTGQICRMEELAVIADNFEIALIEDAAQAFGATRDGKKAGSFGRLSCFSMNPMKVFGALGEAGAVLTDDADLYQRLLELRYNGMRDRIVSYQVGFNARIDTLHAAIMLHRLDELETVLTRRRAIAARYNDNISDTVQKPHEGPSGKDTFFCYSLRTSNRNALFGSLTRQGVECKTREWDFLPDHPSLENETVVSSSRAKAISLEMICLPIFENMTDNDIDIVINAVNIALEETSLLEK